VAVVTGAFPTKQDGIRKIGINFGGVELGQDIAFILLDVGWPGQTRFGSFEQVC
jgi:hypothetical protein